MIVFHAGILGGQFFLWGETPPEPSGSKKPGVRRKLKEGPGFAPASPYDAGVERILTGLREAGFRFPLPKKHAKPVMVWLPTVGGNPIASSPLIVEPSETDEKAALSLWTVTALPLSNPQAAELLCACPGRQTLAPGVIVGMDLGFWTNALRLAGALVARQRYLPGITQENGTYFARWKPVISGPDSELFTNLSRAMPAVSRALVGVEERLDGMLSF